MNTFKKLPEIKSKTSAKEKLKEINKYIPIYFSPNEAIEASAFSDQAAIDEYIVINENKNNKE